MTVRYKAYIKYILSLLLFGMNGIVASHIALDSYRIVFFRTLIGSLFLGAVFLFSRNKTVFSGCRRDLIFIALSGVAMGASWMLLYEAYARIGVGIASLLYYTGPVIVMALSPFLFGERLTAVKIFGFAAVFCGIFFISGDVFSGSTDIFGIICGLLSAVTYAVMVIANKKTCALKGIENSFLQLVTAFITVTAFMVLKSGIAFEVAASDWIWIILLGVINTGAGCYMFFSSIGSLPVQTVAVCGYTEPLAAVIFSVLLLHETMLPLQIAGAALIFGGAVVSECVNLKKK